MTKHYHDVGCFPCYNFSVAVQVLSRVTDYKLNIIRTCAAGITSHASRHCIYADKQLNERVGSGKT